MTTPWGIFWLHSKALRERAVLAIADAPDGYCVEIREPTRNLQQNAALHAALTDIAQQMKWHGQSLSVDIWKRLCTGAMLREQGRPVQMIPALDGQGFEVIYQPTSKMGVRMMSDLIAWIYAFGAENGIKFRDTRHAA